MTSLVPSESTRKLLERNTRLYQEELENHPSVLEYLLVERGLSDQAIAHFRLGFTGNVASVGDPRMRISIPYETYGGVVQIRFRSMEPNPDGFKYLGTDGMSTRLYNTPALRAAEQVIYLTEGELDTVACWMANLPAVGVPGVNGWKAGYWRVFRYRRVIILGDGDDAGQRFAATVAKDLEAHYIDTAVVEMEPEMDVNKLLKKGGPEAVRELVGL